MAGCASREKVYEGAYEGLKQREQIFNLSNEPVSQKLASYNEYKREPEKAIKKDHKSRGLLLTLTCTFGQEVTKEAGYDRWK